MATQGTEAWTDVFIGIICRNIPVLAPEVIKLTFNLHDDVIKWKHFASYWPFVREIHRSPVNSPSQRPVTRSFDVFFDLRLNKQLSKQWWGWWFETLSHPLWRHCNVNVFKQVRCCVEVPTLLLQHWIQEHTCDAMITSLLRQNDVATFWRNNDVIFASRLRCGSVEIQTQGQTGCH